MKRNSVFSIPFWRSLLWVQNRHHRHGVLMHTMKVCYYAIKAKRVDMLAPALLHDLGKPFTARARNIEDVELGYYSFHNHEEFSYYLIRHWPVSDQTKKVVRYHYLIRGIHLAEKRQQLQKLKRLQRIWTSLSEQEKADLHQFLVFDDLAK